MKELLRERVSKWDGFFVGMLSDDELEVFDAAVEAGVAFRSYEGGGGLMGLAKVRLRDR